MRAVHTRVTGQVFGFIGSHRPSQTPLKHRVPG
jgi:hypothetical protein